MTVIVYSKKHEIIAFDSRLSRDHHIVSDKARKDIKLANNEIAFAAGSVNEIDALISAYTHDTKFDRTLDAVMLVADSAGKVKRVGYCSEDGLWENKVNFNEAIGCGAEWALAALDFGKSPYEAVAYAITKNSTCGGTIREYHV